MESVKMEATASKDYKAGKFTITGYVKPGYEPVLKHFCDNFTNKHDKRTQICVYVKNELVIDLYGKITNAKGFDADSKTAIMSSSKSIAAILMALMVDQGVLDYTKPICHYWPEFAQNGKDKVTVADLLRHKGGLHKLHKQLQIEDMFTENIKNNSLGSVIETDTCMWPPGYKRQYHSITRDWIANEIFRRVEPKGRTMGEYLREEVNPKFGLDIVLGANQEELSKLPNTDFTQNFKHYKSCSRDQRKTIANVR